MLQSRHDLLLDPSDKQQFESLVSKVHQHQSRCQKFLTSSLHALKRLRELGQIALRDSRPHQVAKGHLGIYKLHIELNCQHLDR